MGLIEIRNAAYPNTAMKVVRLPDTCTKINARAFVNCAQLRIVEIPASSVEIADDAFADSSNVVIVTHGGAAPRSSTQGCTGFRISLTLQGKPTMSRRKAKVTAAKERFVSLQPFRFYSIFASNLTLSRTLTLGTIILIRSRI